jgi:hypothetical protein
MTAGFRCEELLQALLDQEPAKLAAIREHARTCAACASELTASSEISAAARTLRESWESPGLWPRIRASIEASTRIRRRMAFWGGLAAAAVLIGLSLAGNALLRERGEDIRFLEEFTSSQKPLFGDPALKQVERAEAAYRSSIERLAREAAPRLADTSSPLVMSYREKLQFLDAAIADCRDQISRNRYNAHLRRQLLDMYRQKQETLAELVRQDPS